MTDHTFEPNLDPASRVAIVGIGETQFSRKIDRSTGSLVVEACHAALEDAGLSTADVDGIVTEASVMPSLVPPDELALALGTRELRFSASSLVGGAGVVGAPLLAAMAISSGRATTLLSYYGANFGSSPGGPYAFPVALDVKQGIEMPMGWYGQPVYFSSIAQRYRHAFGLTPEQQAAVAISARTHASHTPGAMRQEPIDLGDYLASPMIAEPFRALDCSLINDGAVAFVMTTLDRARDLRRHPVVLEGGGAASAPYTQGSYFTQAEEYLATPAVRSGARAFDMAGLEPTDADLALIYDCFTISTILQLEDLGFCKKGDGAQFVASGALDLGGQLPTNTHGGLLSHAYTLGGSHIVEAVRQLRRERSAHQVAGAEVAVVAGLGLPDHATIVLARD